MNATRTRIGEGNAMPGSLAGKTAVVTAAGGAWARRDEAELRVITQILRD